ncbi:hypothetical protein DWU99_00800 [Dyella psychrodurans]|uniref:Uncharacterized protein n=1 Tax=Dyella psychrodurans TaxID=1927960 RepID=A0A370XCA4_9GAMM|nr:hypothetical protein DWU99_00800 [Dyella psychrodurans]
MGIILFVCVPLLGGLAVCYGHWVLTRGNEHWKQRAKHLLAHTEQPNPPQQPEPGDATVDARAALRSMAPHTLAALDSMEFTDHQRADVETYALSQVEHYDHVLSNVLIGCRLRFMDHGDEWLPRVPKRSANLFRHALVDPPISLMKHASGIPTIWEEALAQKQDRRRAADIIVLSPAPDGVVDDAHPSAQSHRSLMATASC